MITPKETAMRRHIFLLFSVLLSLFIRVDLSLSQTSIDEVRYEAGQSKNDVRLQFKLEILHTAMQKTTDKYGRYKIVNKTPIVNAHRAIHLMQSGKDLNVFIALTNKKWEENTIAIRIPIRRGLVNYRLLLIHKDEGENFQRIESLRDLLKMRVGSKYGWSTTSVLENAGFTVIPSDSYDGLFAMLDKHRFDFIPRGVNEIYDEYDQKKGALKNIMIQPNLALYIPNATYVFVSPKYPKLAQRLQAGLETMVAEGSLTEIVERYFRDDLARADLGHRRIIHLENPLLPPETPLQRKALWIDPLAN